jgi:pyruvate kinase
MADQSLFRNRARTKIIATVGPACRKLEQLAALVQAGADVFRLNMAHGDVAVQTEVLKTIRQLSNELNWPLSLLPNSSLPLMYG